MAKNIIGIQNYPRIEDEGSKFYGYLNESHLNPHTSKINLDDLKRIIINAIENASKKSSRTILGFSEEMSDEEFNKVCKDEGRELFKYFLQYCGDPASTAHACLNQHYSVVGKEQFRNRLLQKQRMNSGWRYQYIAKGAANSSKRVISVSDINSTEADFNATIKINNTSEPLNIYVSVKNRTNTMGGQDWPKAIFALEDVAKTDKNRNGPYICVFGIAMEKGLRNIKCKKQSKQPYSYNTEVWKSDFFWPFFTNYTYDEIIRTVLSVLIEIEKQDELEFDIPKQLIDSFGEYCRENKLLNEKGCFNDPYKLADLFCGKKIKGMDDITDED